MAIKLVNNGTSANDGTGDPLITIFDDINDNFSDTTNAASKLVQTSSTDQTADRVITTDTDLAGTFDLGDSITKDVQSSPTDTTSGRLLTTDSDIVEIGGLGTASVLDVVDDGDDADSNKVLKVGATVRQLDLTDSNIKYKPSVAPTIDFNYAENKYKLYTGFSAGIEDVALTDAITFTRSSSGTGETPTGAIRAAGVNTPRLTFEDGVPQGYLSEESRTNLLTQSEFENGLSDAPTRSGLVTLDTMDYGAGSVNALAFGYDGTTSSGAYKTNYTTVIGTIYVISVYVEMDDGLVPLFGSSTKTSNLNDFVFDNPSVPTDYKIDHIYLNTYRVSGIFTASSASAIVGLFKYATNSSRTFKVTGYQLEVGSFPTSYIKTQASTVTRAADSMVRTLGDEWNPNEGTFVVEFDGVRGNNPRIISLRSGAGSFLILYKNSTTATDLTDYRLYMFAEGAAQYSVNIPASTAKIALSFGGGTVSVGGDTGFFSTGSYNDLFSTSLMSIGCEAYSTPEAQSNGTIKSLTYYPKALPASELKELSRL